MLQQVVSENTRLNLVEVATLIEQVCSNGAHQLRVLFLSGISTFLQDSHQHFFNEVIVHDLHFIEAMDFNEIFHTLTLFKDELHYL